MKIYTELPDHALNHLFRLHVKGWTWASLEGTPYGYYNDEGKWEGDLIDVPNCCTDTEDVMRELDRHGPWQAIHYPPGGFASHNLLPPRVNLGVTHHVVLCPFSNRNFGHGWDKTLTRAAIVAMLFQRGVVIPDTWEPPPGFK